MPPRAFEIQRNVKRVAKPSFANLAKMSVASWACEVVLQNRSSFFWQCCKTCFVVTVLQHRLCCKTSCVAKPHVWLISWPQHYMLIGSLLSSRKNPIAVHASMIICVWFSIKAAPIYIYMYLVSSSQSYIYIYHITYIYIYRYVYTLLLDTRMLPHDM